jgi:hypothetical protein
VDQEKAGMASRFLFIHAPMWAVAFTGWSRARILEVAEELPVGEGGATVIDATLHLCWAAAQGQCGEAEPCEGGAE